MAKKPKNEPELVPQPHGGALLSGGVPGNKGGTGRPPSTIRRRLRGSFEDRIPTLEKIADGEVKATAAERISALKLMAQIGFGPQVSTEDVRQRLGETLDAVERICDQDTAEKLLRSLRGIWKDER